MKSRRSAREAALQALYQSDVLDDWSETAIEQFFIHFLGERTLLESEASLDSSSEPLPHEQEQSSAKNLDSQHLEIPENEGGGIDANQRFAHVLAHGVAKNLMEIDGHLNSASTHWSVARMARVDRNILRIATFEMAFMPDIPCSVSINEGIEVSKRFGGPESPQFINGVLDRVAHDFTDRKTRVGAGIKKAAN